MRTALQQGRGVGRTHGNGANGPKQRTVDGRFCGSPEFQATRTPRLCRSKNVRLRDGPLEGRQRQQTEIASAGCVFETLEEDLGTLSKPVCGVGVARFAARYTA